MEIAGYPASNLMAKNLKALAMSKMSGFRHLSIVVPEWEGATVILREPSAEAWLRWQDVVKKDEDEESELSVSKTMKRNLDADVTLFIDVLLDADEQPVFSPADADGVAEIYGPVHSRLLKKALNLITGAEDAKEK